VRYALILIETVEADMEKKERRVVCLDICARPLLAIGLSEAVCLLFKIRKERNGPQSFDLLFAGGIRVAGRFDLI